MSKRLVATVVWFFAGWYLGGYIALFLGVSDLIGPILGISVAAVFGGDPLGVIWPRGASTPTQEVLLESVAEELSEAA